jgi:sec-independent protein translocase protein TatC
MAFPDEPRGAETPSGETAPSTNDAASHDASSPHETELPRQVSGEVISDSVQTSDPFHQQYDETYSYGDGWSSEGRPQSAVTLTPPAPPPPAEAPKSRPPSGSGKPPKPPEPPDDEDDDEEEGMARMSFLEHLEELRKRLLLALAGVGVAFALCLLFSDQLWNVVFEPAGAALRDLHVVPPTLKLISPTDTFQIMWMKVPILFAVFLSSPWLLYQVWAFIAPGLYKRERRWAAPFVLSSAGLFVLGGIFAYFIAFRYGLEFLLGLGIGKGVDPNVNVNEYYDLFVDVMLGVGIIFEIPVLLFLLTLIHVANPAFLVRHSRYAILAIVVLAAIITPTGDVFNLALFATPMIILFYIGIFASYLLVLHREKRRFPWRTFSMWVVIILVVLMGAAFLAARYYGFHFVPHWPIFVR